ncbi:hypothetical protein [Methanococcus maripaludis]|uniref:Uncharacterized protein n=2 Tax=Methanococcus maripaludis TaxID=39152 RepID=A0A7J9PFL6_METMI|nr:hypothetical protein [Methanococcus maripaludis]MBA2862045.1 hypothetical protein [Methanococcus maripaludis]
MIAIPNNMQYMIMPHSELKTVKKELIDEAKKRAEEFLKSMDLKNFDEELENNDLTFSLGLKTQKLNVMCLKIRKTAKGKYRFYIVSENFVDIDYTVRNWKN